MNSLFLQRIFVLFGTVVLAAGSSAAVAQTLTITDLNISGTPPGNTYYASAFSGSGTATVSPGGSATVTLSAALDSHDFGCPTAQTLQTDSAYLTLSFPNGDSLTLLMRGSLLLQPGQDSGGVFITAGTGAYSGIGGGGNLSLAIAAQQNPLDGLGIVTVTGSGSVTLGSAPPFVLPVIFSDGIVPVYSSVPAVQPGSWISIYGANLATATALWNGDFPQSLAGTSVSIDGKPGYLWFVGPGQINLQVPDDANTGCVTVKVNTPTGSASYGVVIEPQAPSFSLWPDGVHPVGLIFSSNGYDVLAPPGSVTGVTTRAAKAGETIILYGVGFGPEQTAAPAGQVYIPTDANSISESLQVTIGGQPAQAGAYLVGAGLYQLNIVVPTGLGSGDQKIVATLGVSDPISQDNAQTQSNLYIPIQ